MASRAMSERLYKDRKVCLVIAGIAEVGIGCMLLLAAPLSLIAMVFGSFA